MLSRVRHELIRNRGMLFEVIITRIGCLIVFLSPRAVP